MDRYDAIILGLGPTGAASAHHLAKHGYDVLGLDRYHPPHPYGASAGRTHPIHTHAHEPPYATWAQRAWDLYNTLEKATQRNIITPTTALHIGTPQGTHIHQAQANLQRHGSKNTKNIPNPHELEHIFTLNDEHQALTEPTAGYINAHHAIQAHLDQAKAHGAQLVYGEQAWGWAEHPTHVRVSTHHGNAYTADDLVVAIGPWLPKHVPELNLGLKTKRHVSFAIDPPKPITPGTPVFTYEPTPGTILHGIPRSDGKVTLRLQNHGSPTDPDDVDRFVDQEDEAPLRSVLESHAPGLNGPIRETLVRVTPHTPDGGFILDRHPKGNRTLIVTPPHGHGVAFAPALGEAVSQIIRGDSNRVDTSHFAIDRFL